MKSDQRTSEVDALYQNYFDLADHAGIIVRELRKTAKADTRRKLRGELRSLDTKRIALLDQLDDLAD
jgi:hypothetical protein